MRDMPVVHINQVCIWFSQVPKVRYASALSFSNDQICDIVVKNHKVHQI